MLGMNMEGWSEHKTRDPRPVNGYVIKGMASISYRQTQDGTMYSMGRFFLDEKEVYRAWGLFEEEHCSFNSVKLASRMSDPIEGCPDVSVTLKGDTQGILVLRALREEMKHMVTILGTLN